MGGSFQPPPSSQPSGPFSTSTSPGPEPRKAKEGYEPDDATRRLIQRVTDRVSWIARTPARWALEREHFENIAMASGQQWIDYSDQTKRFTKWTAPAWFPTPVQNEIDPRVGTMVSQLLRARPAGRVRPNTPEPSDREAANVADMLLAHFDDVTDEDMLRQDAAAIVALTGTVIFKDWYNPRAGRVLQIPRTQIVQKPAMQPATQCPGCGYVDSPTVTPPGLPCPACQTPTEPGEMPRTFSNGEPAMTVESQPVPDPETGEPMVDAVPEGEVCTQVRMLFNFYWDQKASRLEDAQWCGEAVYVDLNWIDQNYPEMGPYVAQENGIDSANFFEASLLSLVGPSIQGSAHYGGSAYQTHGAVLRWYEERPSAEYPRGLLLIVANGVLLYQGDLPIKDEHGTPTGDFSFTMFRYNIQPGRMAGRTPVSDMVPLQRRVNGITAQIVLNRKTLTNPWLLAPKGSGLNPSQVGMRPGAVILYNYIGVGAAPQVVPGTPLPAQVYQELEGCIAAMDRLAQDTRVSINQMPPGVKSGIALNFLKEQADEAGVPRLQRWGQCIAERGRKRLFLAQQNYLEDRAVKVMGAGSDWQVRYWKGADLRGNTDVSVDPASLIPRSRSAEIQTMLDAAEQGLLNPTDPVQRQKMLEKLGLQEFDVEVGPDRRRQRKEMALLDQGQMVPIGEVDNDEIHLLELIPQIKDPSFDTKLPEAQLAYMQHYRDHKMRLLMRMASEVAPGANGAGGQPPVANGPPGSQNQPMHDSSPPSAQGAPPAAASEAA